MVDARSASEPGSSQLRIYSPIEIYGEGENATVLRGTLVFDACCAGGVVRDLRIDDGGDCCVRCEGGHWELSRLRLCCSHGSALLACGGSRISLSECTCGGEGEEEVGYQVMLSAYVSAPTRCQHAARFRAAEGSGSESRFGRDPSRCREAPNERAMRSWHVTGRGLSLPAAHCASARRPPCWLLTALTCCSKAACLLTAPPPSCRASASASGLN